MFDRTILIEPSIGSIRPARLSNALRNRFDRELTIDEIENESDLDSSNDSYQSNPFWKKTYERNQVSLLISIKPIDLILCQEEMFYQERKFYKQKVTVSIQRMNHDMQF